MTNILSKVAYTILVLTATLLPALSAEISIPWSASLIKIIKKVSISGETRSKLKTWNSILPSQFGNSR
jgi:hypothetical protein